MVIGRVARVVVVQPQVAVDEDGQQVGGRHRRGRVPRAGFIGHPDRVDAELLAELSAEVGIVGHKYLPNRGRTPVRTRGVGLAQSPAAGTSDSAPRSTSPSGL